MADVALQIDFGVAILATIVDNSDAFSMLGSSDGSKHAEYGQQPLKWPVGLKGRCWIRPDAINPIETYETTGLSDFNFVAEFEFKDVKGKRSARELLLQAVRSILADNGAGMMENFDDSSNNFVDGGTLKVGDPHEEDALSGPDRQRIVYELTVRAWHTMPLSFAA